MKYISLMLLLTALSGSAVAAERDGAVIHVSGSTNSRAVTIRVWSDAKASVQVAGAEARPIDLDADLTERFFRDVRAARATPGTPQHCMKSASFGTMTTVQWHDYASVDLQCPPLTPAANALALDVRTIQATANADTRVRRMPIPSDGRMIPSPSPEVSPT
jgi:hypothetical protein